jgi:hypothetical protein
MFSSSRFGTIRSIAFGVLIALFSGASAVLFFETFVIGMKEGPGLAGGFLAITKDGAGLAGVTLADAEVSFVFAPCVVSCSSDRWNSSSAFTFASNPNTAAGAACEALERGDAKSGIICEMEEST